MHSLFTSQRERSSFDNCLARLRQFSLLLALSLFAVPQALLAQSTDDGDTDNPVATELEKNLENERKELENVLQERETMLAEQAGIRDQLAEQQKELEEKVKELMELCEQHNAVNTDNPMDCEKEILANQ